MRTIILSLVLIATAGCSTQKNLTNLVKALSKDPATVRISYGPLIFERFVPQQNQPGGYVPMPGQLGAPFLMPQPQPGVVYYWTNSVTK